MRTTEPSTLLPLLATTAALLVSACGGADSLQFDDGGGGSAAAGSGAGSGLGGEGTPGGGSSEGGSGASTGGGSSTPCEPGSMSACYTGPSGTLGVGLCVGGVQTCAEDGLGFGPCEGEVTPGVETCLSPADEDCNGETNESGEGCSCVPGTVVSCYSAAPETEGVGLCQGGTQTCNADGTGYGPCQGEVTPSAELCASAADEDCNGNGMCVPVVLAGAELFPTDLAVDATHVYWTVAGNAPGYTDGGVRRVPLGGGAPAWVVTSQPYPTGLAIDSTSVYFTTGSQLLKAPLAGGAVVTLATGLSYPEAVAVDATHVYVAAYSIIGKVPKNGGELVEIASGEAYAHRVAIQSSSAFWLNNSTFSTMKKVSTTGGSKSTLWTSNLQSEQPYGIAADASNVFWVTRGNTGSGSLRKTSHTGSGTTTLSAGQYSTDVALDGSFAYWVNMGTGSPFTDGTVRRVAKTGGAAVTFASGQSGPRHVAVDGTSIYYSTSTQILEVGKE